jgi:hypothetical protein
MAEEHHAYSRAGYDACHGRTATLGGYRYAVPVELSALIAATTRWLTRAYPASGGALGAALAQAQVRQAVTAAAWLRYPTELDVELLALLGPGGCAGLDWLAGGDPVGTHDAGEAWRSWVDEVVASWAACLLADPALAGHAVAAVAGSPYVAGPACEFRRLTAPDEWDRRAAVLVRHPDLVAPVADLHRRELLASLAAPARD